MTGEELQKAIEIMEWIAENDVKYMRLVYDKARANHPEWFPVIRKMRFAMIQYLASVRRSRWR